MWKLHREGKYCHFLKFLCACVCPEPSKIDRVSCGWTPEASSHSPPAPCVSSKQEFVSTSGPDHWSFRQPQAITLVHRCKHAIVVQEGSGGKPLGVLTGSLILQEDPTWEVNHLLEAKEARGVADA